MVVERRHHQRVRIHLPVRVLTPQVPQTVETLTKDLSLGGLRCISPTLCPVSTDVGIELMLANGNEQLSVRGTTVWFQTIPESEQFEFGVKFSELSQRNKRRLSVYIERLSGKLGLIPA